MIKNAAKKTPWLRLVSSPSPSPSPYSSRSSGREKDDDPLNTRNGNGGEAGGGKHDDADTKERSGADGVEGGRKDTDENKKKYALPNMTTVPCPPCNIDVLRWNRGWTDLHDDMLRKWKCQVFVYMQLQRASHVFFRAIYNGLTYPTLALTVVSSVVVNISETLQVRLAVSVMNIIATVLTAVLRQMDPAERAQGHKDTAAQYNTLLHSIEACMNVPFCMRPEARVFLEKIRNDMIRLIMTQMEPPEMVTRRFEHRVGNIDGIMYGQDVMEIMINNLRSQAMMKQLKDDAASAKISKKVAYDINALLNRTL